MAAISKFSVHTHCNDLGGKVWNPAIKWARKYAVFVVLETDNGITGVGECWCFDAAPDALVAFLRTEIAPQVVGMNADKHAELIQRLFSRATLTARHGILASALSGVDIALWDIQSCTAEQPLWRFLSSEMPGSQSSDGQVYLYGSGGLYGENKTTTDLVSEMQSIHAEGFDIVKMKVGALSLRDDLNRVQAVVEGLPNTCKVIVDGVYCYSSIEAREFFEALPINRIAAFQSPVNASDISGMRTLTSSGIPVMATEAEYRQEIHQAMILNNAVSFLQTAPIACGGISRLRELSDSISASLIQLSLEVSSTAVALLAACHYAASDNRVTHTEYHFVHQVLFDELDLTPVPGRIGWFKLPDRPGLGISIPLESTRVEFSLNLDKRS